MADTLDKLALLEHDLDCMDVPAWMPIACGKALATLTKALDLIERGYKTANRSGWEDAETTGEWCESALDFLLKYGRKPNIRGGHDG